MGRGNVRRLKYRPSGVCTALLVALCLCACAETPLQTTPAASAPTVAPVTASPLPSPSPSPEPTPYVPETVTVRFVGDLMVSRDMILSAKRADGTYDFTPIFTESIRSELAGADLMVGNLETPVAGLENGGFTGRPRFNAPDEYLLALKEAGFTVLTTANNHQLDRGIEGSIVTTQKVRDFGFLQTGSSLSPEDAARLLIADVRNVKVCILAYTYHSTRTENPDDAETYRWLRNYNDPERMVADIKKARSLGADVVLTFTHMGTEGSHTPNRLQQELAQRLVDGGVDAAIFCHSHAVQPFDRLTAPDGREVFVAYSLGNLLADGEYPMSRSGMILELPITFDRQTGAVSVENVRYMPSYAHRHTVGDATTFRLYAAGAIMDGPKLPGNAHAWAKTAWETVTRVVGETFATPVKRFSE